MELELEAASNDLGSEVLLPDREASGESGLHFRELDPLVLKSVKVVCSDKVGVTPVAIVGGSEAKTISNDILLVFDEHFGVVGQSIPLVPRFSAVQQKISSKLTSSSTAHNIMSGGYGAQRAQGVFSHLFNLTSLVAVRYVWWAVAAFVVSPGVSPVRTALDQTVARVDAIFVRFPGVMVTAVYRSVTAEREIRECFSFVVAAHL